MGNINRRNEMPLQGILVVQIFYLWGIDFIGPFPPSFGNQYILLVVDYVSKWVEAIACPKNDANTVVGFIQKNILSRFGAQGQSSVMREAILKISCLQYSLADMESNMLWDWLITLNQMNKQKYPIGR